MTDIADAMILKRLFNLLWYRNVIFLMTSNRPPDELYKNGIQRDQFIPFIVQLKQNNHIISLDNSIDYRQQGNYIKNCYFYPNNTQENAKCLSIYNQLINNLKQDNNKIIKVAQGRTFLIKNSYNSSICSFDFNELCNDYLGAADYQALAMNYQTIFIYNVPLMSHNELNPLRRFITLIDELYQARVRVVITAADEPFKLMTHNSQDVPHDEIFAFDRCASRLLEMQSKEYQEQKYLKTFKTSRIDQ